MFILGDYDGDQLEEIQLAARPRVRPRPRNFICYDQSVRVCYALTEKQGDDEFDREQYSAISVTKLL